MFLSAGRRPGKRWRTKIGLYLEFKAILIAAVSCGKFFSKFAGGDCGEKSR